MITVLSVLSCLVMQLFSHWVATRQAGQVVTTQHNTTHANKQQQEITMTGNIRVATEAWRDQKYFLSDEELREKTIQELKPCKRLVTGIVINVEWGPHYPPQ